MEQIYYTQCPVGYGLGASNGFQIKRMTAGYPVAGDFRHLGVKAFPGGGRTLAPPVLRYRLDGDVAEVARLTPRAQEYQTERGLWGRPGGVFAHGLRLDADELGSFGHWPAGLFDNPGWRTSDPEPTRGRPPDEVDLAALGSFRPASFAAVAALADGADPAWLARVWTALAMVTREGRTLFLIDDPDRLARSIALLTGAFPATLRGDLPFSTFHDRPEELPGYRLQGTAPVVRPNRPALLAQGIIADRLASTIEPAVEPARWAVTLAGWLTRREPVDEADWASTAARARGARRADDPLDLTWADAWLDPLLGFPAAERSRDRPEAPAGWVRLSQFARWAGRSGVADDWLRRRGPDWWLAQAEAGGGAVGVEARAALVAHATLRDAWRGGVEAATGWGAAVAAWFGPAERGERDEAAVAIFAAAPRGARPSFAQELLRGLPAGAAGSTLARLRSHPGADRAMLLPLEAGVAAAALVEAAARFEAGDDPGRVGLTDAHQGLANLVAAAASFPGAVAATLGAVLAVAHDHPAGLAALARGVAGAFDLDAADGGREALAWALGPDRNAPAWLAPALRPRLADPGRGEVFELLRDRVAPDLRPRLARAVLAVAADPGLPDDAFRLAVNRLLLPLAPRPNDPTWAETYLRRTASTWDLFRRLYSKEAAALGVPAWVDAARGRGEVSAEQGDRVDTIRRFARSLATGDPGSLVEAPIPAGTPADRAQFFRQVLGRLGGNHLEGLPVVLDACKLAWPGAFDPGAPGLRGLARPLAERLDPTRRQPAAWLAAVEPILGRLGLLAGGGGFEPDGLLAEVIAALPTAPAADPWALRQFLFEADRAWPSLAALVRDDLAQVAPAEAGELAERWDNKIVQSAAADLPARFWELVLNGADPERMRAIVARHVDKFKNLRGLRWWGSGGDLGAVDDLRDRFARQVPLAPLPGGSLAKIQAWVDDRGQRSLHPDEPIPMDDRDESRPIISPAGLDRWRCLKALTEYQPTTPSPSSTREASFEAWEASLPLASLGQDEAYRFAAWIILGVDPTDPPRTVGRLAAWLATAGVADSRRIGQWADELPIDVAGSDQVNRSRFVGSLRDEVRTLALEAKGRPGSRRPTG